MTDDLFGNIRPTLSKRDQALARAANIMAEGRVHRPKSSALETAPEEEVTPINIEEAVETAPPAPRLLKPAPPAPAERKTPVLSGLEPLRPVKKRGLAAPHWFFQILILLFVLVWVFILGIFIGRGYLMESALGRDLITWIEEKIGRQPEAPKISPQISIETPAESAAAEASPEPEPAPAPEAAPSAAIAAPPIAEAAPAPEAPANAAPEENAVLRTVAGAAQSVGPGAVPAPPDVPAEAPEEAAGDEPVFLTPETLAAEPPSEPAPTVYIPPPPASLPAAPGGGYAVQATYALSEQAAQAVVDRLRRQGFQAYFYENSRRQYLIRVGRFQTIEEARSAREKLSGLGYKDPYISRLEAGEK